MRTIAITLGDNDYGNTFRPLLTSIYQALLWNPCLSRDSIEKAIRAGIQFHYIAYQVGNDLEAEDAAKIESVVSYLLGRVRILFDEQAEAEIASKGYDSGAWYLEVITGNVFAF